MEIRDIHAPTYAELRPLKPRRTATFPVFPDLVDTLAEAGEHPDDVIAYALAVCCAYSYSDTETVAMIMARMGIEANHCLMVAEYVDVLFLTPTAFLLQSKDGRVVILCYRGTPPTSVITWLTDLEIDPVKAKLPGPHGSEEYAVHAGFYRNVRSTRYVVEAALKRALKGQSVRTGGARMPAAMEAFYITGHSLGRASAAMLAAMLVTDPAFAPLAAKLKAVYTYGSPMIGSRDFAAACNENAFLHTNMLRYVYANDIVPQLPSKESGSFAHFGSEYQYRPAGDHGTWHHNDHPRPQLRNLIEVITTPLSFLARQLSLTREVSFHASIADHLPQYYIDALKPEGVRSEFGD
ncbi:MAG TPA: lipase family protein [Solirubrobacteraceae bacterium]|nr:lipase family protein [Solirubrobacteraceae bacterium]